MSRNGAGTYSKVNTFVAGAVITATAHNQNWDDIATEITNSVAADGQTSMTGVLKHANGTVSAPSMTFAADTDTGLYRVGADQLGVAIGGTKIVEIDSAGIECASGIFAGMGATPVGSVLDYAGSSAPTGWLLCYGQTVSRTTYAALFSAIGTTYGPGDGSLTFELPDARGRVAAGKDNMGGSAAGRLANAVTGSVSGTTLGGTGGTESHTLTSAQSAAHTHAVVGTTGAESASHTHAVSGTTGTQSASHTHNTTVAATSSSTLVDTVNVAGGVAAVGSASYTSGTESASHTHDFAVTSGSASASHTHSLAITSASSGSDGAHNNVQPTIIFNKIIFAGV
jgi:microcystin-dependent protein